jgi:hypothetical protein
MKPMPNTRHTTTDDEYDPRDSQLVPGLGFNGLGSMIGRYLRKLFKQLTPSH